MFVPTFPKLSETFIVNKFLGLLEKGLDVHVVCEECDSDEFETFPRLESNRSALGRIHESWPHRPKLLAALLTPFSVLRCMIVNPVATLNYLTKGWRLFGADIFRMLYLDAELIVLAPDVIHFEFGAIAVDRTYLKDLLGCKIVVSFRGYDLNYSGAEDPEYYSEVWENADYLHLLGKDLWKRAMARGCPEWKPHSLIPPAIDTVFFHAPNKIHSDVAGSKMRPLRILSVGRLDWRKGYDYSLEAIKILLDQDIHCRLQIVGGGHYIAGVAFSRYQLGIEKSVEFLGAMTPEEVKERMLDADLLLHAAVSEGFCNAVVEAQSMSLPVLCTDAGGLPENVSDGETGFVVPRRDPRALAEKLKVLAQSPSLRQQMGQAGRHRVQQHFSLDQQVAAFESLYLGLSNRPALKTSYVPG
jgi:colanic acid/amylovoran biosynthesis glycosyltransferase